MAKRMKNARQLQMSLKTEKPEAPGKMDRLVANKLVYPLLPSYNVIQRVSMSSLSAVKSSYSPGDMIQIVFNQASDFIIGCNSYLIFQAGQFSANTAIFDLASGSILNLFNRVELIGSDGTTFDLTQYFNNWKQTQSRWRYSNQWLSTYGSLLGFTATLPTTYSGAAGVNIAVAGAASTLPYFVVPLNFMSEIFGPDQQILPAFLMGGARLNITLESAAVAYKYTDGSPTVTNTYVVNNLRLVTCNLQLQDNILALLQEQCGKFGLNLFFNQLWNVPNVLASTTSYNLMMTKGVAQAEMLAVKSRITAATTDAASDSFKAETFLATSSQTIYGSVSFPQAAVVSDKEAMWYGMWAFDKTYDPRDPSDVSYGSFVGGASSPQGDALVAAVSLNRSPDCLLSGLSVNNSKSLQTNITMSTSVARTMDQFLQYLVCLECYLNRIVVRS